MGRFNIVFDMGKPLYAKKTKIVIEKAVLTKDNETGKVFAQTKMKNVLAKTLIAVKVTLTGYDVSGERIEEKEFTYLDLAVNQGCEFGQKTPVDFQNSTVRSFNVKITETVYSDGSKLTGTESEYYPVPEPELLSSKLSKAEIKQYEKSNEISSADYIVAEFSDLWICTCGAINTIDSDSCYFCGASRENLKRTLDKDLLDEEIYNGALPTGQPESKNCIKQKVERLKAIGGYRDSEKLIERYESEIVKMDKSAAKARQKQAAKITGILALITALCVAVALVFNFVIMPYSIKARLCELNLNIGDTIAFGNYNGTIEWLVLDKQDDNVLLISKCCIDDKPYNEEFDSVKWKSCTLRKWLNDEFLIKTFSYGERTTICETYLLNPNNPEYGTYGGDGTTDKMFLLSIDEIKRYFRYYTVNRDELTNYTVENDTFQWWLRSPGRTAFDAAIVNGDTIYCGGDLVNERKYGVRPAMWVNIGK